MSRDLTPRGIERLLEIGAPLGERPELGAVDTERYELGAELGRGGMGVVYQAFDRELERVVALKVLSRPSGLSDETRQRFLREARAAARLVHPHIAAVYDAAPEAIAMQRVRGVTLAEADIDDPRALAGLLRDAALAIHYAHSEGVVHRDLKPANLMVELDERPHVFVMDFGLAKELSVDASVSMSGSVVGTPSFMAPEQAAGGEVGTRTDVYGLGATLYSCLAGRAPFDERDVVKLLRRVVDEEPAALRQLAPGVDGDLATIVAKAMAKEPSQRYASALALASDLDRWLNGEPIQARPPSVVYRLRRYVSRRQGAFVASALAAGAALLIALPFIVKARGDRRVAEAERQAAEAAKVQAEELLALSNRIDDSIRAAHAARAAGAGREAAVPAILADALEACAGFPGGDDVGSVWYLRGRVLRETGRLDEALAAFDRGDALGTRNTHLWLERGLTLAALYRSGVPLLGEAPPPELDEWRARGARDLVEALDAVSLVAPTPDHVFAEGQLAWLAVEPELAVLKHREVIEMDVTHQEAHLSLSKLYLLAGRTDLGMRHSVIATDLLRGNRPAYLARATVDPGGGEVDPDRELLAMQGMQELLIDFALLLREDAGNVNSYGLRGQVQLREAARAPAADARRTHLAHAIRELSRSLELRPDHAAALVARGVARMQLGRELFDAGENGPALEAVQRAVEDYDEALRVQPELAVACYDRALLRDWRSQRARLPPMALQEHERALADALRAVEVAGAEHPWQSRFQGLGEALASR